MELPKYTAPIRVGSQMLDQLAHEETRALLSDSSNEQIDKWIKEDLQILAWSAPTDPGEGVHVVASEKFFGRSGERYNGDDFSIAKAPFVGTRDGLYTALGEVRFCPGIDMTINYVTIVTLDLTIVATIRVPTVFLAADAVFILNFGRGLLSV